MYITFFLYRTLFESSLYFQFNCVIGDVCFFKKEITFDSERNNLLHKSAVVTIINYLKKFFGKFGYCFKRKGFATVVILKLDTVRMQV